MADDPDPSPLSGFLRLFRSRKAVEASPDAGAGTGRPDRPADRSLVDQAEAFLALRVSDVLTPRADIVAIDVGATLGEVTAKFLESEHSRMPLFNGTLDDPVGVVHIKDIFRLLAESAASPSMDSTVLRTIRRDALYVPGSMRAADLLLKMQASRIHMALVIDEFGGCDGLVTMEDLIEAVVGDIDDEHDDEVVSGPILRGGIVEADGRTPIDEVAAVFGTGLVPDDFEEEIDTLAGLVTAIAGRVPRRGEVILHPDGFELEVLDADPRRVKRVRVRPVTPADVPQG